MKKHGLVLIGTTVIILLLSGSISPAAGTESYSIQFFGFSGCPICIAKYEIVSNFVDSKTNVNAQYTWIHEDCSLPDYINYLNILGYPAPPSPPTVVLNRSGVISVLFESDITPEKLQAWYVGAGISGTEYTVWVAFISGVIVGASACMLLLVSLLGTSLILIESRRKYISVSIAFLCGLVVTYCLVTLLYTITIEFLNIALYFKYVLGVALLLIGIWQVIDFKRENSRIFGTPEKVKGILREYLQKRSAPYAFLVGIIFAFIKIPCFGGPYFNLLYATRENPLQLLLLAIYIGGMLLPIIGVLIAIRLGAQASRIEEFRKANRAYLRLLSGTFLATLAIYLLWDAYISLNLLLWFILAEIGVFASLMWWSNKKNSRPAERE